MQSFILIPHSACRPHPSLSIECVAWRDDDRLDFEFALRGELHLLQLPEENLAQARRDELWRTTCFEAFVRPTGGLSYYELNMAPTTEWATYRFDAYRNGMVTAPIEPAQQVSIMRDASIWDQHVAFRLAGARELQGPGSWDLGISAVIEEQSGKKSYWALAHPDGPPDFHHDACFAASLPPIARP